MKTIMLITLIMLLSACNYSEKAKIKKAKQDSILFNRAKQIKKQADSIVVANENKRLRQDSIQKIEDEAFMKTRAGKIWKKNRDWSKKDCERVLNNEIWIGMSYSMLRYERGLPDSATPSDYGNGKQWQWCWWDYTPSCFYDEDNDGLIDSYN